MITGQTRARSPPVRPSCVLHLGSLRLERTAHVKQMVTVANSKHVIYAGFQQVIADQVPRDHVGILVDEEFGSAILRDAASKGYVTAASIEKSGQQEFAFTYGEDFAQHMQAFDPTFAKVLVR